MIEGLKPYAEYKKSELPWLGDLPKHWEVVPSKSLFGNRKEKAKADDRMLTASQVHGIIARDEFMAIEQRRVMHVFTGADILKQNGVHAAPWKGGSWAGRGEAVEGLQRIGFCGVGGRVGADINPLAGHIIC